MEQHDKYGSFVRIAPNHVSINDPSAVTQIYGHKTGFTKSDFYDAFVQVRPVLFNARDGATHTRKKKYMNPAFSARALTEFEPHMNVELLAWKRQLLRFHKEVEGRVDFVVWSKETFHFVFNRLAPWLVLSFMNPLIAYISKLSCL